MTLSSCLTPSFLYPSFYAFPSLTHSCLIYVIPCILSILCTFHPPPISLVPTFFSWHTCDLWWPLPLHSIVAHFLCTRPCFLLPSKFRPEQDITKTCCMPNMMSWLSWVCVLLPVLVYVSEYPYIYLCIFLAENNKQSRPDVGLLITNYDTAKCKSYLLYRGRHFLTKRAGKQGRSCLAWHQTIH